MTAEQFRLEEVREKKILWKMWRTVREDYAEVGDAWSDFTHDQARLRAYIRGEDVKEYYFYLDSTPTHSYMKYRRDDILFYEYFHGDNGTGPGATDQTGWTELVAKTIPLYGLLNPKQVLEDGKLTTFKKGATQKPL